MDKKTNRKILAMMLCVALLFQVINPVGLSALVNDEVQEQGTETMQEDGSAVDDEATSSVESSFSEENSSSEENILSEESSSSEESSDSGTSEDIVTESSETTEESSSDTETVIEEASEKIETENETETETETETESELKTDILTLDGTEEPDKEGFANAILEGLKNKAESITDLEKYKVPYDMGLTICTQLINDNPDLYYIMPRIILVDGQYVEIVTPYYFTNTNDEKYQKGKQDALSTITDDMSDVQKMLVLHDWIITHTDYDHEAANNNTLNETHSAYGVFANGSAVCQGFALAYKSLLDELNIENYIVFGKSLGANHAWNTVVIDGEYYQVDVTFDNSDQTDSHYPQTVYDMFLISNSNAYFSYLHTDYYMFKDYSKLDVPATSTIYNNAFWQNVSGPIATANNSFYYINNNKLYKLQSYNSTEKIEISNLNAISKSGGTCSGLFRMNDRIYFNDKYVVYSIALDGTDKRAEYQITDTSSGYIGNVNRTGSQVYIELYKDGTFTRSNITPVGRNIELQAVEVILDKTEETIYENDTLQLTASIFPDGSASAVTWTSSNEAAATVSDSGLVTAVAAGTAIITAESNSIKATCTITVNEGLNPETANIVTFKAPDGTVLKEEPVADGGDATPPEYPVPSGYSLTWDGNYTNVTQDETVTAVVTPIKYNITYALDGGTNNPANPSTYTIETNDIILAEPTKGGMTFNGWYYEDTFSTKVEVISNGSYGDVTLYAKWTVTAGSEYIVTFKLPDGTVLKTEHVAEGYNATPPEYTVPDGYTLSWDGNYTNVKKDETVTAVFTPIEYRITYILNGGNNSLRNPKTYTIETDDIVFAEPSMDGMKFEGWYSDRECLARISRISKGSTGDITAYAKWTEKRPEEDPEYKSGLWTEKINDVHYTGAAIKPIPVVYDGSTKLISGKDYSITYKNNTNVGTAQIIITGRGNYKGKITAEFKILPVDIENAVAYDMSAMYKANKTQMPVPTVELRGKKLRNKKDFSVSYEGSCIEPGEYDVTISGINNYTGSKKIKLVIASNSEILISKVSVSKIPDIEYTGNPVTVDESKIVVKYKGKILSNSTDYEIRYDSCVNSGTYSLLIVGKGQYKGVKVVNFKIKGIEIKKTSMTPVSIPYTGSAQMPEIQLKYGKEVLVYGKDYTTAFENNVNKGKARVKITGLGRFSGTVIKTFNITAQPISADDITFAENNDTFAYVKGGTVPEITVRYNGKMLRKGTDYTVTGKNNQKTGNAMLVIRGIGNYSGTVNKNFTVTAQDISNVLLMTPDVEYTGRKGGYKTKPVLMDTSGKTLSTSDYDSRNIIYKDASGNILDKNSVANTGDVISVTIKGKGNYSGEITGTYRVIPKGYNISRVRQDKIVKEYTGTAITLTKEEINLYLGKTKIPSSGFEIVPESYVNNINKGTASVTVRGIGEYGGIKTITFKIDMQNLKWGK